MKSIQYVVGDATWPEGEGNKIIAHICNDEGGWGRGFVVAISEQWMEPEEACVMWMNCVNSGRSISSGKRESTRKEDVLTSVSVGRTANGDEIICCPRHPQELFVLPRHDHDIYRMPHGLLDPIAWYCGTELAFSTPPFRYFEAFGDRAVVEMFTMNQGLDAVKVASWMKQRWKGQELREISDSGLLLIFATAIGGRIQLTQSGEDRRIGIRIDYDREFEVDANGMARELEQQGFYRVGGT